MESVYHIVAICVNETSWAHVWRLRFRYLRTGYDSNVASTSTLHLGNTSGNVIYVDASSLYPRGVSMGNLGSFLTANLPYPGGASTSDNLGFPAHTTPTNPNLNF
jgi:hypothetical protein